MPSKARRELGITPGDRLDVEVRDNEILLRRRLPRASDRLRGLGAHAWQGVEPSAFVRELRDEDRSTTERRSRRRAKRA